MTFPLKDALNKRWKTWYSSRRQGLVRRGSCWTRYCKYRCELERERPTRCDRIQRTRHKEEAHCVTCPLPMTQIGHCGVWPQQGWRALSGQRKKNVAKGWHSFWSPRVPFILFYFFLSQVFWRCHRRRGNSMWAPVIVKRSPREALGPIHQTSEAPRVISNQKKWISSTDRGFQSGSGQSDLKLR